MCFTSLFTFPPGSCGFSVSFSVTQGGTCLHTQTLDRCVLSLLCLGLFCIRTRHSQLHTPQDVPHQPYTKARRPPRCVSTVRTARQKPQPCFVTLTYYGVRLETQWQRDDCYISVNTYKRLFGYCKPHRAKLKPKQTVCVCVCVCVCVRVSVKPVSQDMLAHVSL